MIFCLKTWQRIFALSVLLSSASSLVIFYTTLKEDGGDGQLKEYLIIPTTVGDAKRVASLILRYKDQHYYSVFGAYFSSYILLQSLCIPGSIVLSILAGYLFSAPFALLIICICSTLGATTAYILSNIISDTFGNIFVSKHKDGVVGRFNDYVQARILEYKSNLFFCVFMLRATPVFPNWAINLCSPLVKLPLRPFILGTFTGVAPLSVVHVWTGRVLNDLSNDQKLITWQSVATTSLMAVSLSFLFYMNRKSKLKAA